MKIKTYRFEWLCEDCPKPHPAEKDVRAGDAKDALKGFTAWYFEDDLEGRPIQGLRIAECLDDAWVGTASEEMDFRDVLYLIEQCGLGHRYASVMGFDDVAVPVRMSSADAAADAALAEATADGAKLQVVDINQYTDFRIANYQGINDLHAALRNFLTPPDASVAVVPVKTSVGFDAIVHIEYKSEPYAIKRE